MPSPDWKKLPRETWYERVTDGQVKNAINTDDVLMPLVVTPPIDQAVAAEERDRLEQMGRTTLLPKKRQEKEDMRDAIRRAFILRGGVDELMRLEPDIFYKLFAKLIPTEIHGSMELTFEQLVTKAIEHKEKSDDEPAAP